MMSGKSGDDENDGVGWSYREVLNQEEADQNVADTAAASECPIIIVKHERFRA